MDPKQSNDERFNRDLATAQAEYTNDPEFHELANRIARYTYESGVDIKHIAMMVQMLEIHWGEQGHPAPPKRTWTERKLHDQLDLKRGGDEIRIEMAKQLPPGSFGVLEILNQQVVGTGGEPISEPVAKLLYDQYGITTPWEFIKKEV